MDAGMEGKPRDVEDAVPYTTIVGGGVPDAPHSA
jgi:hypothetical protein